MGGLAPHHVLVLLEDEIMVDLFELELVLSFALCILVDVSALTAVLLRVGA